jgi:hypothetical protein
MLNSITNVGYQKELAIIDKQPGKKAIKAYNN